MQKQELLKAVADAARRNQVAENELLEAYHAGKHNSSHMECLDSQVNDTIFRVGLYAASLIALLGLIGFYHYFRDRLNIHIVLGVASLITFAFYSLGMRSARRANGQKNAAQRREHIIANICFFNALILLTYLLELVANYSLLRSYLDGIAPYNVLVKTAVFIAIVGVAFAVQHAYIFAVATVVALTILISKSMVLLKLQLGLSWNQLHIIKNGLQAIILLGASELVYFKSDRLVSLLMRVAGLLIALEAGYYIFDEGSMFLITLAIAAGCIAVALGCYYKNYLYSAAGIAYMMVGIFKILATRFDQMLLGASLLLIGGFAWVILALFGDRLQRFFR